MQEESFLRVIWPVRGYSAFLVEEHARAIELFQKFLQRFPETNNQHAFVLYTLGQVYQAAGQMREAADKLGEFIGLYRTSPEAQLAALQRAEILFALGAREEAVAVADAFYASEGSATLRIQARLRVLQNRVEAEEFAEAAQLLQETRWQVTTMPELAVLAFAALQTGDALLRAGDPAGAIRCYRLVPPHEQLVKRQRALAQRAEAVAAERRDSVRTGLGAIWNDYYDNLAARTRQQLEHLESMEDYTPGFLLRYGQAFLLLERPFEAWIIFEEISGDESFPQEIREQAHYRWILATFALSRYEETLIVARNFRETYPQSELAPDALYLVAQAYQEERRFVSALEVYDELVEAFPEHRLFSRWLFTRGFNRSMVEQYEGARSDFTLFWEQFPQHPLVLQARLWHALTYSFEREFEPARELLLELEKGAQGNEILPEVRYRLATIAYSTRDFEQALERIEAFLADFPGHLRAPEATVLRGDILMGMGELIEASAAFASVTPEAAGLFPYAIFQRGKIFQALERYDLMIEHFSRYVERTDLDFHPRLSEALYWMGWAHLRLQDPAAAIAAFHAAVERFGDDPQADEIPSILAALESIRREILRDHPDALPDDPLFAAESFEQWREWQIAAALEEDRLTWFSRLMLYGVDQARQANRGDYAELLLQEIDEAVPLARLDPVVVVELGTLYQSMGYAYAVDYFRHVIENHPTHRARGQAFYGLALAYVDNDYFDEAERFLRRFDLEIPIHPLADEARLLRAEVQMKRGNNAEAKAIFERVLRSESARGLPHVRALTGLARANTGEGHPERAIAYWQRIYTLYRAFPEQVAEAYLESARLFVDLERDEAARNTLNEMLRDENLRESKQAGAARDLLREIEARIGGRPDRESLTDAKEDIG